MKNILLSGLVGFSAVCIYARMQSYPQQSAALAENSASENSVSIIGCAPPSSNPVKDLNGRFIPALSGWGHHAFLISTKQDSAQFFFNQGINFYFGYHLRDAQASFMEAARFDSSAAMVYWGEALSMGPYYNSYSYKMKPGIPGVLAAMERHRLGATGREQKLMDAMEKRYSSGSGDADRFANADRVQLDRAYAGALSSLMVQYPDDDDIKVLYVDAVMLEHKWDFWKSDGTAKPWTPELVSVCEGLLQRNPRNAAAIHYYIHLTEASDQPERALAYADVLKNEMPGVGHMVHMSTHSYQRNGLYAKGVWVNEEANAVYNQEDSLAPMLGIGRNSSLHIFAVQSFCAMNAGMYGKGMPLYLRARNRCIAASPAFENDPYSQSIVMLPEIACVRLGKWDEIMRAAVPDPRWKYSTILYHFARGMANVRQGRLMEARADLDTLRENLGDSLLNIRLMPYDKPSQCGRIAAGILEGELIMRESRQEMGKETKQEKIEEAKQEKVDEAKLENLKVDRRKNKAIKERRAIAVLRKAVAAEDSLIYREPQQWMIPAREYLGASLLKIGKAGEAERVYREDLVKNPGNGWSLLGLYQSLVAQQRSSEAAAVREKYRKAFEAADVKPAASVF